MTIFFSSDNHFFHSNILKFVTEEGSDKLIRPGFSSIEEMNETMIERHNSVVGHSDKWYCVGDFGMGIKKLPSVLSRLNGHKRLILGNHDYTERKDFEIYFQFFEKVMESRRMGPILVTHRPTYLGPHEDRIKANVHGHIHEKVLPDKRYLNVSVEQINYTPVSFEEVETILRKRGIDL